MKSSRAAFVVGLVTLAAAASGCSAGSDTANGNNSQTAVADDAVELDGVQFDVRRDPG
jgi:hypothetical protein